MVPYVPSPLEAKHYYYGLPSRPRLVARSSSHLWVEPTGPEAYLVPKELTPLGPHPLNLSWETKFGPVIWAYLRANDVECTSLDPIRIGTAVDIPPPAVLWIGVRPGSLSHQAGIDMALHCKYILSSDGIQEVEVEIRESEVVPAGKLYLPGIDFDSITDAQEPFSTTLGIPICARDTPHIEGTAAFFFTDSTNHRDKLFLLTVRHVLFHPDHGNELYKYDNPSQPKKEVCLLGNAAFKNRIKAIKSMIEDKEIIIEGLTHRLEGAEKFINHEAADRRKRNAAQLAEVKESMKELKDLLRVVETDWKDLKDRVIGHVVLSPPITLNAGNEGYTEDWAVIEVDPTKIDKSNFVGNVIDLRAGVPAGELTDWMSPNPDGPRSFRHPVGRLLSFFGTISDDEMLKLNTGTVDENGDPTIMVLKRGSTSGLTVGRLNTIRSFTRQYFKDQPEDTSKDIAVLPRSSKSGAFSEPGDSGSSVLSGEGNVAGIITSGAGANDISDVTYLSSVTFILTRLALHGFQAHIFPSVADLAT